MNDKSIDDLKTILAQLLRKQFNLRMQKSSSQLTQTHLISQVRRNIARVKTVLRQRQ